jgi:transglutaminase-like putative cysteine protease
MGLESFLLENHWIDYSSPIIDEKAKELFSNTFSDFDKAKKAYDYVRDEIHHSFDIQAEAVTCKASEVLKYKTGICHAKSNLLAALLRSQKIPTGLCYQHITLLDDDSKGYCLHCFNTVFIDGRWIQVDARGNTSETNAQFSINVPLLAFPNRQEYDEYFFDGIWATPDIPTMKLLESAQSLQDVLDGLPEFPGREPDIVFRADKFALTSLRFGG